MGSDSGGGQVPLDDDRDDDGGADPETIPTPEADPVLALERLRAQHQERLDRGARLRDEHAARHQRPALRVNLAGARGVLEALQAAPLPVAR